MDRLHRQLVSTGIGLGLMRLQPGAYLDEMIDWQREMLDDYGEAFASLMASEWKGDVDPS